MSAAKESSIRKADENLDEDVVAGFGDEWTRFDQSRLSENELTTLGDSYFHIFPFDRLSPESAGMDIGCGSGRWARFVAPRVGSLTCVDASVAALDVARRNLRDCAGVRFCLATVGNLPFADESMDFGYCLGVLHHVPDTEAGLRECVAKLRPSAPFLLYLYYSFENRPAWFRGVWRVSEALRFAVSRSPHRLRYALSQIIAALVYLPLSRTARLAERLGVDVRNFPLSSYRETSFYIMRNDALDRFGTRLEQRFSRAEIQAMMERSGLRDVRFSERMPHWCAVGYRVD